MRVHFCGVMSVLMTLAFVAALILNLIPELPAGSTPLDVVVSEVEGSMGQ